MNNSAEKPNPSWKTGSNAPLFKPHMNISVFGMGIIGSRCADNWQQAGANVTRWNRTPKDLPHFIADAATAAQASPVLSFYLKDSLALRTVFEQICPTLRSHHFLMNHSTIDLPTTEWLAEQCAAIGCAFVDAPFTGSKIAAGEGKLMYYLAGSDNDVARAEEILAPTASAMIRMGATGNATVIKLATNLIAACQVEALSEAYAISRAHGISADAFANAITQHGTASALAKMKLPTMLAGDFDTHFSLDNMRKDSVYALELAKQQGLTLPSISTVSQRMTELCQQGHAEKDYTALASPYLS
jgi:3-hydroxyisobutyrate dehydrogenase/glyoxylate/succinic semialdehyde reductase